MITQRNTAVLAAITVAAFTVAAILGNHSDGLRQSVANVAWYTFLLGAVLLVVVGVARLGRWVARRAAPASGGDR